MKGIVERRPRAARVARVTVTLAVLFSCAVFPRSSSGLEDRDSTFLAVSESVIRIFRSAPEAIWPGYDLSRDPFLVYMPDRWALLMNVEREVDGFGAYPQDWPHLSVPARVHLGAYGNLVGQLAFDLQVDSLTVVAIPYLDRTPAELFGFIVHEAFHQYQRRAFGAITDESEESYPVEDRENTALAYVEMRLLARALKRMRADEKDLCEESLKQFAAVREHRWNRTDPFVRRYEQGQELREGTAKYVEVRGLELLGRMGDDPSLPDPLRRTASKLHAHGYSAAGLLLRELHLRTTKRSVSPEDMPRYRIYPVGAAQGCLLDYLGIPWKERAALGGPEFTFSGLVQERYGMTEAERRERFRQAVESVDYDKVLASTDAQIRDYRTGFDRALKRFRDQAGYRVEIDLRSRSYRRSRSSSARRWLGRNGRWELRDHYDAYTLSSEGAEFEVRDLGLLERTDPDTRVRKIEFFLPGPPSITLDGRPLDPQPGRRLEFAKIELLGKSKKMQFRSTLPGMLYVENRALVIDLSRP